ncbi:MAG: c-type cytochrome [Terracidiphilus sp.]|jgi:cytochrome c oxidase cbb3-type subunit 3/ubiquinol-cytochrome c reductase cytochrome c subunit
MRVSSAALACLLAISVAGCEHAPGYPPSPMPRPSEVTDFNSLYGSNCAACHGANGQGGPAIDLANPEYQALVDDTSLRRWISNGMPGTEMAAFARSAGGMLTDAQVNAVIAGMRKAWSKPNVFAGSAPPPYAQNTAGDTTSGQQVYSARCASCHQSLHQSPNQDITSSDYLALVGDQALRSIIIAGRPDIGQPDWSHLNNGQPATPLSAQDVSDLVAYLGRLRSASSPVQATNTAPDQSGQTGR